MPECTAAAGGIQCYQGRKEQYMLENTQTNLPLESLGTNDASWSAGRNSGDRQSGYYKALCQAESPSCSPWRTSARRPTLALAHHFLNLTHSFQNIPIHKSSLVSACCSQVIIIFIGVTPCTSRLAAVTSKKAYSVLEEEWNVCPQAKQIGRLCSK